VWTTHRYGIEKGGFLVLMSAEEIRLLKIGYFMSLFFILLYLIFFIRAIVFPESFNQITLPIPSNDETIRSLLLSINTHLLVFLLTAYVVLRSIYSKPSKGWEAESILWTGPCVALFFDWLSMMDGVFRIFIYMVSLCCSLYAFLIFRRYLKETALTKHQ
jgi:hypothetical protein